MHKRKPQKSLYSNLLYTQTPPSSLHLPSSTADPLTPNITDGDLVRSLQSDRPPDCQNVQRLALGALLQARRRRSARGGAGARRARHAHILCLQGRREGERGRGREPEGVGGAGGEPGRRGCGRKREIGRLIDNSFVCYEPGL